MGIFSDNPVLQREVRGRMRLRRMGRTRATGWTAGLIVLVIAYFYARSLVSIWHGPPTDARDFWNLLVYGLLFLCVLLAPALSATAITQEREQQTWEALTNTRLTAGEVILGKWLARLAPLGLLILIALPLVVGCAIKADMPPYVTLAALLFLALTAGFYGMIGLTCSFLTRRTAVATAVSLSIVSALCLGTSLLDLLVSNFLWSGYPRGPSNTVITWVNPFYAIAALLRLMDSTQAVSAIGYGDAASAFAITVTYVTATVICLMLCLTRMIARYCSAVREG